VSPLLVAVGALIGGAMVAAVAVPPTFALLRRLGHERQNFEGRRLLHSGGLALMPAPLLALWLSPGPDDRVLPAAATLLLFALLGLADDLWGSRAVGGLRGHLGALLQGRVTTGAVKALGGSAGALLTGAWLQGALPAGEVELLAWGGRSLLAAVLIALSANALNLLDLRPLRSLKGFWTAALPLWAWGLTAGAPDRVVAALGALLGASIVYATREARRQTMLGDAGANMLGAFLGLTAAVLLPWPAQAAVAALLVAFHLYTEGHSFSAWIEAHPTARRIDEWGWKSGS
jgi:UDP-GlcNAc:undecaprenyl-phosphate/decaprenyl-phosphate GlcNAc-1-phosphate transferase